MRIARFTTAGTTHVGIVDGGELIEVTDVCGDRSPAAALVESREALDGAVGDATRSRFPLAEVDLLAPVAPGKFWGAGLNYSDHAAEAEMELPSVPIFICKASTSVIGSGTPIERPLASTMLDYEAECAVVIGRRCRHITPELAPQVIAGFTIVNDVSVRDWQAQAPTHIIGKSWDTHGPIGPWLTSADAVPDPNDLELRTYVNDELRQDSSTKHQVFDCYQVIAHLSTACTLEPGDVITTGTPGGVGWGMDPKRFLEPGDVVRIEIESLGVLENPVVLEASDAPRIG